MRLLPFQPTTACPSLRQVLTACYYLCDRKRVKGVVDAFRNILAVAYPLPNSDSPVPSLAVACARRVGIGMEGWIDDQLDEEFVPVDPTLCDEVGSKRESRRVELRDEWWEGVPHHALR